jgi:hypothetical protein
VEAIPNKKANVTEAASAFLIHGAPSLVGGSRLFGGELTKLVDQVQFGLCCRKCSRGGEVHYLKCIHDFFEAHDICLGGTCGVGGFSCGDFALHEPYQLGPVWIGPSGIPLVHSGCKIHLVGIKLRHARCRRARIGNLCLKRREACEQQSEQGEDEKCAFHALQYFELN